MAFLLKEDGNYLLQETGDKIILDRLYEIVSAIKNISILITDIKKSNLSTENKKTDLLTENKKTNLLTSIKKGIMRSNNSNRTNL